MKYKLRDKRARNKKLIEFAARNPELTLRELGSLYKISYERVRQILKRGREDHGIYGI